MKSAIVLGAGMVGVSTALALVDRGWQVALVDRKAPGQETSFGNAGIIQAEAVEPYAMPRSIGDLFDIALGRTNDVHYALSELPYHFSALIKYWWYSESGRHRQISASWAKLISQATRTHQALIDRAGADNLVRRAGFRVLLRSRADFEREAADARRKHEVYGVGYRLLSPEEFAAEEPALKAGGAGGVHWTDAWTVSDPGGLVAAYAALFEREGGRLLAGDAETLKREGRGWSVETSDGRIEAETAVLAVGPWSSEVTRRYGHAFPMVYKRGYHAHYRSPQPLNGPVMDADNGYLLLPMRLGTRITTGAHLARQTTPPSYAQLERAEARAREIYDLGPRIEARPWHGTRPCMPDMLPVIGPSHKVPGLWLNFGHGHQGFTLGPASGEVIARMMSGEAPGLHMTPFRPERY